MKHGELLNGRERWCGSCSQMHGPLYLCDSYSPETKDEIFQQNRKFEKYLTSGKCEAEHGKLTSEIMKIFAGLGE